jgi:hypothetical protein
MAAVQFNGILSELLRHKAKAREGGIADGALRIKSLEFAGALLAEPRPSRGVHLVALDEMVLARDTKHGIE